MKCFLVEDSPLIRRRLTETLEEMVGLQVAATAEDEAGAVAWLAANGQDCAIVIIDIFLKGGSGLGVLQSAREANLPAKLVVLSNYANPALRKRCLALGADRVFDKPGEIDALIGYCVQLSAGRA